MADISTTPTPTKAIPLPATAPAANSGAPGIGAIRSARPASSSLPPALSYGRPGQWLRDQYDAHARRLGIAGTDRDAAPRDIRHLLSAAAAEESVAAVLASLGQEYTVWHNVATDVAHPDRKLDHVVLGPTGLYALRSDDWGASVRLTKGELRGNALGRGEKPIRSLSRRARLFARDTGIRFSALMMVVPDDAVTAPMTVVRRGRLCPTLLVRRSWLPEVVRSKMSGMAITSPEALDDARTQLQESVRFV
jgi:molecular chaperone DnaJ